MTLGMGAARDASFCARLAAGLATGLATVVMAALAAAMRAGRVSATVLMLRRRSRRACEGQDREWVYACVQELLSLRLFKV